jgi:transcriptional regulator with XRE-family HTH domain
MPRNLNDILAKLPDKRRKAILEDANAMLEQEMTLIELRKTLLASQAKLGKKMGIKQSAVSRIESRGDMLLSTLRQVIGALDGKVKILAQFPDRPSIFVNLGDALDGITPSTPKRAKVNAGLSSKERPTRVARRQAAVAYQRPGLLSSRAAGVPKPKAQKPKPATRKSSPK